MAPGSGQCGRQSGEPFFRGKLAVAIVLPAASIRVMPVVQAKKNPDHHTMIRGCPCLSSSRRRPPDPRGETVSFQAGILTPGSSSFRAFPPITAVACAKFVPGYSGGPVLDLHEVPSYARFQAPIANPYRQDFRPSVKWIGSEPGRSWSGLRQRPARLMVDDRLTPSRPPV